MTETTEYEEHRGCIKAWVNEQLCFGFLFSQLVIHLYTTDATQEQSATTSHTFSRLSWPRWDFGSSKTE